jgi:phage tail sheath protein FI
MNVEIGMAVVRPAEFIILKFSHKLQTSWCGLQSKTTRTNPK